MAIPQGQYFGTIKLYGIRPMSSAQIYAESTNGYRQPIKSDPITLSFYFPWTQLFCAILGGVVVSMILKRRYGKAALGVLTGVVLFGLALFGAIAVSGLNWQGLPVTIAKLPTENFFAAFIIGIIGSMLGEKAPFKAHRSRKPAAKSAAAKSAAAGSLD